MTPIARIIDANFNRAREALRTLEDIARFALDDASLSGACKAARHDLRAGLDRLGGAGLDRALLLASRDTPGDVGTEISTVGEGSRAGLRDVALAAGSRLSEALRSIEESVKALGADASAFEALRYRAYTLEQRIALALSGGRAPQWRLCILITHSLCRRGWAETIEACLRGGADCIQLREKDLPDRELLARAQELVALVDRRAAVIVNDRADIALLAGADGVHLGQDDLGVRDVRRSAGERLLIGVSTADIEQARGAARDGADYCGVGPMFATTTKHKPVLSGPAYLLAYLADAAASRLPHLAIGGISPQTVGELWSSGCRGIAVSSAVCCAEDPEDVCRKLLAGAPQTGHSHGSEGV